MLKVIARAEIRPFLLVALIVIIGGIKEPRLLQAQALNSILLAVPLLVLMALGQMLVIVSRGIDVSVGSTLGLTGMLVGLMFRANPQISILLALLLSLALGALFGLLNGLIIAGFKIPPIIATLGTLSAYRGLVFIVSKGDQVDANYIPSSLTNWSHEGPFRLGEVTFPWLIVIAVVVALGMQELTKNRQLGRNVFAIGSHDHAAKLRGIPMGKSLLWVYTICGMLAGFAGLLYISRYGFINPGTAGQGMELTVIAAAVIGGCDVSGGTGSVLGVIGGCIVLGVVSVALAVLGIATDWQMLVYGFVILCGLGLNLLGRRLEAAA